MHGTEAGGGEWELGHVGHAAKFGRQRRLGKGTAHVVSSYLGMRCVRHAMCATQSSVHLAPDTSSLSVFAGALEL